MKTSLPRVCAGLFCLFTLLATGCAGKVPKNLEQHPQRLTSCPSSPNCVFSQATDSPHHISPMTFTGNPAAAKRKLIAVLKQHPSIEIISHNDDYIHGQFSSDWFGFVDDMEFIIQENKVQMRSASRLGYSDMGANRRHLEEIRRAFE